jgi:hypothetical protein
MNLLMSMALSVAALSAEQPAATKAPPVAITVRVKSGKAISFAADELGRLGRAKVQAGKDKGLQTYEGVPLASLLRAAGITWGARHSGLQDCYVVVEGADGYRAVFSIPEIDPGSARKTVLIADRCDGKSLSKWAGPYQVIEEDAKSHER